MADRFDLSGKVALITGGNSGIGLGIAKGVASAGANVAIWGRNADKNTAAKELLSTYGRRVLALECNVSDRAAVEDAFRQTIEHFGRLDGCFANAAVTGSSKHNFLRMSLSEWQQVLHTNLDGTFNTFQVAARYMAANGGGVLVGTTSTSAIEGAPRNQHYAASKGGMISMIRGLAVELARHNIRVHALMPGWIDTAMTKKLTTRAMLGDPIKARIPMGRWGTGDDFAGIAIYLMSSAAAYQTGDTIVIDGGYSLF